MQSFENSEEGRPSRWTAMLAEFPRFIMAEKGGGLFMTIIVAIIASAVIMLYTITVSIACLYKLAKKNRSSKQK